MHRLALLLTWREDSFSVRNVSLWPRPLILRVHAARQQEQCKSGLRDHSTESYCRLPDYSGDTTHEDTRRFWRPNESIGAAQTLRMWRMQFTRARTPHPIAPYGHSGRARIRSA